MKTFVMRWIASIAAAILFILLVAHKSRSNAWPPHFSDQGLHTEASSIASSKQAIP